MSIALVSPVVAASIPAAEALAGPTATRLDELCAAAAREGWAAQTEAARAAARGAYEKEKLPAAAAWLHVARWSELWGRSEGAFVAQWIREVEAARVAHPNMATRYETPPRPLGDHVPPALQRWLLGNARFSEEFFQLVEPVDYLPRVFDILRELHGREPVKFQSHASLALALAVVYDVPPPPNWPHGQVSAEALKRAWPDAARAFAWWVEEDQRGRTFHRLGRLGADDLKFVVDAAAPFDQLAWSRQISNYPLVQLERAYTVVRYRDDRAANGRYQWTGRTYTLPEILSNGGICVDQAYFATQAGKARGVPTLFFYGAGRDGRHAWFGFLDAEMKWRLDAGRYAEQRFVTGLALDPQTWRVISDHELKFLAERFRALPSFRQSQVHAAFAADYLATGEAAAAVRAARKAVNYERRNEPAWETLLSAEIAAGRDAKAREGTLREAMLAFQRYPDLESRFSRRLTDSLRARGETSAADVEQRRIMRKYQGDRNDLSLEQARDLLARAIATEPLPVQLNTYNTTVDRFGRGAGIAFFDQIVAGFVEHLLSLKQAAAARQAVERARGVLTVEPGSQLEQEFERLARRIK